MAHHTPTQWGYRLPLFSKSSLEIAEVLVQTLANWRKFAIHLDKKGPSFQSFTIGPSIALYGELYALSMRNQMLRITRKANGGVVFKLSGQLTAENVAEMEALIAPERAEGKARPIVLDCTDLTSVDSEAVRFLEKWEADSIKLKNCGLYIREWVRRQRADRLLSRVRGTL